MNVYYNFYSDDFIYPYVTIGAGFSENNPANLRFITIGREFKGKRKMNLAWNVGVGLLLDTLGKDYFIDVGYRYVDLGKIQTVIRSNVNYATQKIKGHQGIISVLFKL